MEFDFCTDKKLWFKRCSSCHKDYPGTKNQTESELIFLEIFGVGKRFGDGLQSLCKMCAKLNRRRRNGVNDGYDEHEMYKNQNGRCFLCTIELHLPYRYSADPQGARVDHDHKTGRVRGLLCHKCNSMIGMYESILDVFPEFDLSIIDKYIERGQ